MIDCLEFNDTFSTIRLYGAFKSHSLVCVFENGSTLGVLYIYYSVVDDQRRKMFEMVVMTMTTMMM